MGAGGESRPLGPDWRLYLELPHAPPDWGVARSRGSDGTESLTTSGGITQFAPISLGFKYHFLSGGEWGQLPSLGLLGHLDMPTRATLAIPQGTALAPSLDPFTPTVKLAIDTSLPWEIEVGCNVGLDWTPSDVDGLYRPGFLYALALSRNIIDPLRLYVEASGDRETPLSLDGGLVWLLTPDLQLDWAIARQVIGPDQDWQTGLGVSVRI